MTNIPPRRFRPWLLSLLIAAGALACGLALRSDMGALQLTLVLHAWPWVLLASALSVGNYLLRIVRWRWYLAHLGHPFNFGFTLLVYVAGFAFTLSPAKLGEVIRARYYREAGVPLADVGATFCAERLLDIFAILVLAALGLHAAADYRALFWSGVGLVALSLALLTLAPWARIAERLIGYRPSGAQRIALRLLRLLDGTRALLRPRLLAGGFLLGLAAWTLEGVGLYVLTALLAPHDLSVLSAIGIYALAVMAGALSFLPGGIGSTEAVMTVALMSHGYALSEALLLTLVCRLVTLWLAIALGWAAMGRLHFAASPAEVA
jgi:glycosyltransferase 2 family protein